MLTVRDPFSDLWLGPGTNASLKKLIDAGAYSSTKNKHRLDYRMNVDEDTLNILVDVPGVKPDDVAVEHLNGYLTIVAKRGDVEQSLSLRIADAFDAEQPIATLELGVLTISVPRMPKPEARRIPIDVKG